ncbi:MAG: hypothetical protein KAJ03_01135 [Gammaproteobacteria bacterium]|nr:hypothetical protein [Gammaproteobacteria bacterium]
MQAQQHAMHGMFRTGYLPVFGDEENRRGGMMLSETFYPVGDLELLLDDDFMTARDEAK